MSLHLIESTKMAPQSARKRFGATASIVLHATLVVGAFTVASAAPVVKEMRGKNELIYYPPKPPEVVNRVVSTSRNSAPSRAATPIDLIIPTITMPSEIPVDIPPISTNRPVNFTSTRDFARRTSGGGDGTDLGGEPGITHGSSSTVMSESQVDRQVTILSGYRTPRYPEVLRAAGVEETLNATFVVDTLGRVEQGSLEIPAAQHAPFVVAVREALANARFRPAEVQGRRVRQRVTQAFVFSLQRN